MSAEPSLIPEVPDLAGCLEQLRLRLGESAPGPRSEIRQALREWLAEDSSPCLDPSLIEAWRRLDLMIDVWECLDSDSPEQASAVRAFFENALARLEGCLPNHSIPDATAWILQTSQEQWGEYLELIDPDLETSPAPDVPLEDPIDEGEGPLLAIPPAELIKLLTGQTPSPPPPSQHETPQDDEPAHHPRSHDEPSSGFETSVARPEPREIPTPPATATSHRALLTQAEQLDLDPELRDIFLADAGDLFDRMQSLILTLGGGDDPRALHEVGRCLHTLKGASGSVGLSGFSAFIHELEDALEQVEGVATAALIERLEASLSLIENVLSALRRAGSHPPHLPSPVLTEYNLISTNQRKSPADATDSRAPEDQPKVPASPGEVPTAAEVDGPIRIPSARIDELMDLASDLMSRRKIWVEQAVRMKQFAATARECGARLKASLERVSDPGPGFPDSGGRPRRGARRKDRGDPGWEHRRMSELAEDLIVLGETAQAAAIPMGDEAEVLARISSQLWDALHEVRMVPVKGLFQRLVRVARDAARIEGRTVEVVLIGDEIGLDRSMQERAFEPLMHVVRNAVGHGIESPPERAQAGKSPVGRIVLEARREGNTLVLSVEDDGRGLDYEAIAAKGRRLGLLGEDEPASPERLNALIFQAGFSTRPQANAVSGRGVGMDVVAHEVNRLRGTFRLTSHPGRGTRMTIRLPSRLALGHVMIARVADQAFAVPIEAIDAVCRLGGDGLPDDQRQGFVVVNRQRLPLIDARAVLGFAATPSAPCPTLLRVRVEGEPIALGVEAIDGAGELVIRPLGPLLAGHPVISGTSVTTGGEVILVLNLVGLVHRTRQGPCSAGLARASQAPAPEEPRALVVDDSISVRRVARRQLRALGFQVVEAHDGEQALRRIRNQPYRLILTDLEMPRMDGIELLTEMGRSGALASTPVIVATTRSDPETRDRVLGLGARAFLAKPLARDELRHAIRSILGQVPDASPERPLASKASG